MKAQLQVVSNLIIQTSYFAKIRDIKGTVLSISRHSPSWYTGETYSVLAPSKSLLYAYKNGEVRQAEYCVEYNQMLSKLNVKEVYNELLRYDDNVTLLCYEKPCDFCHRRLVAEWLERELNISVPEFGMNQRVKKLF